MTLNKNSDWPESLSRFVEHYSTLMENQNLHDEVILSFYIPGKELIVAYAAIRATNKDKTSGGYIIGCHFENLKFEHKRLIQIFVSEKTVMEFFVH